MPLQKGRAELLWHWNYRNEVYTNMFLVLWEGKVEQNSQIQIFFLLLYITVRRDAGVCACEATAIIPLLF